MALSKARKVSYGVFRICPLFWQEVHWLCQMLIAHGANEDEMVCKKPAFFRRFFMTGVAAAMASWGVAAITARRGVAGGSS